MKAQMSIKDSVVELDEAGDYADNSSCKTGATGIITIKAFRPEVLYEEVNLINDQTFQIEEKPQVTEIGEGVS
jgi:hypothetical protein